MYQNKLQLLTINIAEHLDIVGLNQIKLTVNIPNFLNEGVKIFIVAADP